MNRLRPILAAELEAEGYPYAARQLRELASDSLSPYLSASLRAMESVCRELATTPEQAA